MRTETIIKIAVLVPPILTFLVLIKMPNQGLRDSEKKITEDDITSLTEVSSLNMKFDPRIKTQDDVLKEIGGYKSLGKISYLETRPSVKRKTLADDYQFSGFETLKYIENSSCGLRDIEYAVPTRPNDRSNESLRIFWDCNGTCTGVVSEKMATKTQLTENLRRSYLISLESEICQVVWSSFNSNQTRDVKGQ
jgi:hypothetical protein